MEEHHGGIGYFLKHRGIWSMRRIGLNINGHPFRIMVEDHWTLLDVLRNVLGYTGAKEGCGKGECGACAVLMEGRAVQSCLVLAVQCRGRNIVTIEGLAKGGKLDPLQKAFHETGAIQCGYCTSGMIITARSLLDRKRNPAVEEIKEALAGNLCRCTGYVKIIEAVRKTARGEDTPYREGQ